MKILPTMACIVLAAAPTLSAATNGQRKPALPFIENDYPKALVEARAKKLPIFAEAWAPW
jgi:hypothetical protein